ncbi:MAG: hypothetical protein N2314_03185 [Brevinematales bacterium]|nr:hypothetical protein [Brevinematales bacterium]
MVYKVFVTMVGMSIFLGCATDPKVVEKEVEKIVNRETTNTIVIYVTNAPQNQVDTNMMTAIYGEWLVIQETYQTMTNGSGGEMLMCVVTNNYDSTTNNGRDGAYSYVFKSDGYVNKKVYNAQGGVMRVYTNLFWYMVVSNTYGYRIDLELLDEQRVTVYWQPDGPMDMVLNPVEVEIIKTNYLKNYTLTNEVRETNTTYFVVTNTNGWLQCVERERYFISYVWRLDVDGNNVSNQVWTPDTNTYQVIMRGGTRSLSSVTETLVIHVNQTNVMVNGIQDFVLLPWETRRLRRLP